MYYGSENVNQTACSRKEEQGCSETAHRCYSFSGLTKVISNYEDSLANHLDHSTVVNSMWKTIQNYFISSVTSFVTSEIKSVVDVALFFSWQMDETTAINCHLTLSVIVINVDTQGRIQEFLFSHYICLLGKMHNPCLTWCILRCMTKCLHVQLGDYNR